MWVDKPTVKQIVKWLESEMVSMEKYKAPTPEYEAELRTLFYVRDFIIALSDKRVKFDYTGTEE